MSDAQTIEAKIDDLLTRGIENIIPNKDSLKEILMSGKVLNVYLGIDPTATRIHLGHAFSLRKLQVMAELGHNVTFLVGDFTARIGDTSDKNDERPQLSKEEIDRNFANYKSLASTFLDFDKVKLLYNSQWLEELTLADVLQTASTFSLNDFASRELIRQRMESGKRISLAEVLYPLMQGYDSYHLDTDIQFGATDQTFNMQAGRTLIKRLSDKESYVVASGYLPGTDDRKMSKSWGNAIWLDDSAEEIFGKVMSLSDETVESYFLLATNLEGQKITEIMDKRHSGETHPMEVKKILARRIVEELQGADAVEAAENHFVSTVQNKSGEEAESVAAGSIKQGRDLLELLVERGLVETNSQARRLFEQGAIRLNDEAISLDSDIQLKDGDNQLRVGKRRYLNLSK